MPEKVGVPIKILHEAEGHTVTLETKTGEVYRGRLDEAEDNMNCQLSDVTRTARDGQKTPLAACFIRGSQVRFLIMPDILKNAPVFKRVLEMRKAQAQKQKGPKQRGGRGGGRGGGPGGRGEGN